jgi:cytochrome c-type biogenesis protein CcmH/NrfG
VAERLTTTTENTWSAGQVAAMVVICLAVGTAGGWMIRRSQGNGKLTAEVASTAAERSAAPPNLPAPAMPSPDQLKAAADSQAAPLLGQLKSDSNNFGLLVNVGNIYYDAKQYPTAVEYYQRALKQQPNDTSVRTDMATAIWYTGNADRALAEFQKVLSYDPNKANALFNMGIVKWRGKNEAAGAIALWQKLLATSPNFDERAKVEEMIQQAKASTAK